MKERIRLIDIRRIQDIGLLERNDEVEGILISIFTPNQSSTATDVMKRASSLTEAQIKLLEHDLQSPGSDIGKVFIHTALWLNRKNRGLNHLREAFRLLAIYYCTFSLERDTEEELFTYRFLHVIFYHLPLFVKPGEVVSFQELTEFITAYEINLEKLIADIFKPLVIIQPNAPFWLLKSLLTYYCSKKSLATDKVKFKRLIELLLDNYVGKEDIHWAKNVLDNFEMCFEKDEYLTLKKKVANLYYIVGLKYSGLQAISVLRIAASMFQQIEDQARLDEALGAMKKKEMTIDWQFSESTVPIELSEKLEQEIHILEDKMEKLYTKGVTCKELLKYLFNNCLLPSKESIESQQNKMPISYFIATVTPMTEGRSGVLTSDDEKKEHWKATVLNRVMFTYSLYRIYRIIEWVIAKIGEKAFKKCLNQIYRDSIIYDEKREALINEIMEKYLNDDIIGFVYSVIPQIEHSLKMLLENMGISVRERDIKHMEEINLNTILTNYKGNLTDILGENFYEILWLCFLYDFGLNIRNSVLHGGGLTYLSRQYALLLFYILWFIFHRAYQLSLKMTNDEDNK